jgi:AAA+ ATPase superfamily predicted ATPase
MSTSTKRRPQKRQFETQGNPIPGQHYLVENRHVVNQSGTPIRQLVDQGRYFTIFAPRQMGKTTFFVEFARALRQDPLYAPILLSFQTVNSFDTADFYGEFQQDFVSQLLQRLKEIKSKKSARVAALSQKLHMRNHKGFKKFFTELNAVIRRQKIIIFIDEFDGIPERELANFLNTLREMYLANKRIPTYALHSISLVGVRNIAQLNISGKISPFNIADQVRIPPFTLAEIENLYGQYTEETGQPFTPEACRRIHTETGGQPFLCNRLGQILANEVKPEAIDPIVEADVEKALKILHYEDNDHFANIVDKARQYRNTLARIVLAGNVNYNPRQKNLAFLEQFGLIKRGPQDVAQAANPIYQRIFLDVFEVEKAGEYLKPEFALADYVRDDGSLDMVTVLNAFATFIKRLGVNLFEAFPGAPREVIGQYLLLAYVDLIVAASNGDSNAEVLTGNGYADIKLLFRGQKFCLEMKVWQGSAAFEQQDKKQILDYVASEGLAEGYLVYFDNRKNLTPIFDAPYFEQDGKRVHVFQVPIVGRR